MNKTPEGIAKLAICCGILLLGGCGTPPPPPPLPHSVSVTHAIVCTVPEYLEYTGNLVANISVEVKAQVSGILVKQNFIEGQKVKAGDLLLVIDPRPYEAALAKSEAQLSETIASLNFNKEKTRRYAKLVQDNFVSQLDYDQYVTNVLSNEAMIDQNQAEIETAKIHLGYCFITAPMDCITGLLHVKPGNYVDAAADTPLTVLNQIQPILVNFYVPETDLYTIQMRQREKPLKIEVFTEASHAHAFEGTLSLINNQVNPQTGSILMQGTLTNEETLLWPGHFVDVRVVLDELQNALMVPTEAVLVGQKGHYVYVVKPDHTVEMRAVEIGQRFEEQTVVYTGITEQDQIVTQGQLDLYPGMTVAIQTTQGTP